MGFLIRRKLSYDMLVKTVLSKLGSNVEVVGLDPFSVLTTSLQAWRTKLSPSITRMRILRSFTIGFTGFSGICLSET